MKRNCAGQWMVGAVAAGLVFFSAGAFADEPGPDQVREQIRKLERRAQELKADGKEEDAKAVAGEAAQLRERIARMEKERHAESAGDDGRRAELKHRLEEARGQMKELREAGNEDKAADVQRQIHLLEEAYANSGRRPEGERGTAAQQERGAAERKIQHVREAAAHLREAGMIDIAEKLGQESDRMEQQLRGGGDERRSAAPSGAEIERMRAELQELRQAVRQLNARLDGVNRDRSDAK